MAILLPVLWASFNWALLMKWTLPFYIPLVIIAFVVNYSDNADFVSSAIYAVLWPLMLILAVLLSNNSQS